MVMRTLLLAAFIVNCAWAQPAPAQAPAAAAATTTVPGDKLAGFKLCDCGGPETYDPQCGKDGQTYGNKCLLDCANVPLQSPGVCNNDGCYPFGEPSCGGNWDSLDQVCSNGLTYQNLAEANCGGTALKPTCYTPGVCNYHGTETFFPTTGGKGIKIADVAKNTNLPTNTNPAYDYSEALTKALLYYDSMISGNITAVNRKRLTWRDDSCFSCKGKYGEDLSGGYYEAGGSFMKYPGVINGYAGFMLALGGLEFPAGYEKTNTMADLKFKVKWAADHVLNAHVEEFVFAGFLGNSTDDFDFYGPPELYEKFNDPRPVGYVTQDQPGSEIVADASATLTSAYLLLKADDPAWADNALVHARQLYNFGKTFEGSYMDSEDKAIQTHADMYGSDGFNDELAWAALWLYKATNEPQYLADAKAYIAKVDFQSEETPTLEAATLWPAVLVLLAREDPAYIPDANAFFNKYLDLVVPHTPAGLAYPYHWGANRHGANVAFLAMIHQKNPALNNPGYRARLVNYAMHQVNYLLGDAGRSWLVGFGKNFPTNFWHKMSYTSYLDWDDKMGEQIWMTNDNGPWAPEKKASEMYCQRAKLDMEGNWTPQKRIAYGLLYGAALFNDGLIAARKDYSYTESTVEYNAGITGALAAMAEWYDMGPYAGINTLVDVLPFGAVVPAPAPAPLLAPAPVPAPQPAVGTPTEPDAGGNTGGSGSGTATSAPPPSAAVRAEILFSMLAAAIVAMFF